MYVKEMNSTNYIAAIQHCYSKEIMDAKEVTNSVTICTTTEGNYKVFSLSIIAFLTRCIDIYIYTWQVHIGGWHKNTR